MRAALSIVFVGLLVTLPLKQVLAQAQQQQSQTTATQEISTSSPALVGVPALERGSSAALLWSAHATAPVADSLAYDVPPPRKSVGHWIGIGFLVLLGLAVVGIIVLAIGCAQGAQWEYVCDN